MDLRDHNAEQEDIQEGTNEAGPMAGTDTLSLSQTLTEDWSHTQAERR